MATINAVGNGLAGQSGSGAFAGNISPVFTTPNIGIPSAGTLTNCTGLPISGLTTAVTNGILVTNNSAIASILAGPGSAGLTILSQAAGAPVWSTLKPITRVNVRAFLSTGTYTPTSGMTYCIAEVQGAGGGGGGATTSGATTASGGGGGGGGGYTRKIFTAADIGASQSVTIGAGGTAGAVGGGTGGVGGTTSLGGLLSASGGNGGVGAAALTLNSSLGGSGGLGASGNFITFGAPGGSGFNSGLLVLSGAGGSSFFGGGGRGLAGAGAGTDGASWGGGGAGGATSNSAQQPGGTGYSGIVVITEFISI